MKVQKGFILGLLAFPALALAAGDSIEKWQVQDYWGKLEVKMTEQVVIDLLGQPQDKETINNNLIWYYPEIIARQGDAILSRPEHGFVRLKLIDGKSLLHSWKVPNWEEVFSYTEQEYLAEQRHDKTQQNREQQQAQREAEAERVKAEREAARLIAIEQAQQRREEQAALKQQQLAERQARQTEQADNPNPKKRAGGFALSSYRYWFSIAGLFLLMAVGISITAGFKK